MKFIHYLHSKEVQKMNSKQLSVATRTRDISKKSSQILFCMKGYPEGMTPKLISLKTGLNVNTVKSILPKLEGVTKTMRGLYKVAKRGDTPPLVHVELTDWNFHNLILTAPLLGDYIPSQVEYDFNLVNCILSATKNKVTLRLSSDWPLNVSSICLVGGLFSEIAPINENAIMVSTIEFNHDYRNLRLDGVQSISLDNLVEQFKIYQKKRGLRIEHKTKVPMTVNNIVDMLSNNPNSIEFNVKLNEQKAQLERLTLATQTTTKLLYSLIDKR